eukprot:964901-Alexandrium_andersonii.AAC.1
MWGNPFKLSSHDRLAAINIFADHLVATPSLLMNLPYLLGKSVHCRCRLGEQCHGQALIQVAFER